MLARRLALAVSLCAGLGAALAPRTSRASPPPIVWEAPPGCPDVAEVERRAAALLAGSPRAAPPELRFRFTVRAEAGRWVLEGVQEGAAGSGARTLRASECAALAEAASLLVALAVDPTLPPAPEDRVAEPVTVVPPPPPLQDVPRDRSEEGPAEAAPAAEAAPLELPEPPPPPRVEAPARRVRGELGLQAGIGLGALPRPAALLRHVGGVRWRALRVGGRASVWLPREAPAPTRPEVGGRFWLASGGVQVCGVARPARRVEFPLCAAFELGLLTGRGTGTLHVARTARALWAAVAVGPAIAVEVSRRVAVVAAIEGLVVVVRPHFEVTGAGEPCCGRVIGGSFLAGLELRLP